MVHACTRPFTRKLLKLEKKIRAVLVCQLEVCKAKSVVKLSEMGQLGSRPSFHKLAKKDDAMRFVYVSDTTECFQFEPAESYMVSYGIDLQTSAKYKYKTLGPVAIAGAKGSAHCSCRRGCNPLGGWRALRSIKTARAVYL